MIFVKILIFFALPWFQANLLLFKTGTVLKLSNCTLFEKRATCQKCKFCTFWGAFLASFGTKLHKNAIFSKNVGTRPI